MTRPVLRDNVVHLHRTVVLPVRTLDEIAREGEGVDLYDCLAMPSARAAAASRWSLLRVSSVASIAIALATALYFIGQLVRGVL